MPGLPDTSVNGVFMKKRTKIILTVCGTAFLLFLLLPFFEASSSPNNANQTSAKAEPQIFTSNPLTDLVGRIAQFFRSHSKNAADKTNPLSQNEELMATETLYASATTDGNSATQGNTTGEASAYLNAYLQNDDGEWVLIRQTAPEGSSHGMHEINVKENAYDRYIAQERQARFTPVMRLPGVREEVPDSKLARVFNPIKRLFGGGKTVDSSLPTGSAGQLASARRSSSSSSLDKNKEKSSNTRKMGPIDWNGFRNNPFAAMLPGGNEATKALANIIMPDAELKNMADWLAGIKYPNAEDDPNAQQAKQDFEAEWFQEKYQQATLQSAALMEEKAKGTEENTLSLIISESCGGKVQSVKSGDLCELSTSEPPIQEYKEHNALRFYEKTNLHLPNAGITVVLHKTDQQIPTVESLNQEWAEETNASLPAETQQAVEMYHFMQENCPDCYWVATGAGKAQELQQTVEAAGLVMKGDPLNRHEQFIEKYLEQQKAEGKTDEELRELKEQLTANPTPYTAYTQEELQQLHQDTLNLLLEKAKPETAAVPFFTHAANANQYYNENPRKHPMFYGTGAATSGGSLQDRSEALTDDVADFINSWRPIIQQIKQEANQQGVTELSTPRIQQILQENAQQKKDFDATNDLGTYQK